MKVTTSTSAKGLGSLKLVIKIDSCPIWWTSCHVIYIDRWLIIRSGAILCSSVTHLLFLVVVSWFGSSAGPWCLDEIKWLWLRRETTFCDQMVLGCVGQLKSCWQYIQSHIHTHTHTRVCVHKYTHPQTFTLTHTHTHTHTRTHAHTHTHTHTHTLVVLSTYLHSHALHIRHIYSEWACAYLGEIFRWACQWHLEW